LIGISELIQDGSEYFKGDLEVFVWELGEEDS